MSEQSVATALKLEAARYRNASSAIPAGVLRQTGGEPLSAQELADLAAAFTRQGQLIKLQRLTNLLHTPRPQLALTKCF